MSEMEEGTKTAEDPLEERPSQQSARVGSSGKLIGEWVCDADVFILGHFQGKIDSGNHDIQIEKGAKVKADIQGKNITVLGKVTGNITASVKILVGKEAKMIGNLSAPQIAIKEGAKFKGRVSMLPLNK
jgi:cytoskeletal protein CcmA (bactofilin family)